jgi:hypothetical protein
MTKKVKPDMSAKEIATLHYELALEGNKKEWAKTIRTSKRDTIDSRGHGPFYWWNTSQRIRSNMVIPILTSIKMTDRALKSISNYSSTV